MNLVSQNGWPVDPPRRKRVIPGTKVGVIVADGVAGDVLMSVLAQIDKRVEDIDMDSRAGEEDDWGYANRTVRGSTDISNHASATAVDVNATRHPLAKKGTFSTKQVAEIHKILAEYGNVVRWGGDYNGRVDEMHFEINAKQAAVAAVAKKGSVPASGGSTPPAKPPASGARPTIRNGSTGQPVRDLQTRLNRNYPAYSHLSVDGQFGPATEKVVREFQRRAGLAVDGIVGPNTWARLGF